jgi:anti-sigma regulatory factor (Ser/Thr protein kinase)
MITSRETQIAKRNYVDGDNAITLLLIMENYRGLGLLFNSFFLRFATLTILLILFIFNTTWINAQTKTDSARQSNDLVDRHFRKVPIPPGTKTDFDNMLISRFGGVWAKSYSSGLAYFDGTEMRMYRHSKTDTNSISSDMIWNMAEDAAGNLYAITWDAGLNIINKKNGHISKIVFRDSIEQYKIAALMGICIDEQFNVYIGLFGRGFLIYNPISGSVKHFNLDASKPGNWFMVFGNSISLMKQDPVEKNIIWMMSNDGHLYSFNRITLKIQKIFSSQKSFPLKNMIIMGRQDIFLTGFPNKLYNRSTQQIKNLKRFKDWGFVTPFKKSETELYCYYNPFEVVTYNIHSDSYTSYKLPFFGLTGMSTVTSFMDDGKDNIWMIADGELYYSSVQYSLFSNYGIFNPEVLTKTIDNVNNSISDIKWDPVNHWYFLFYSNWIYVLNEKFEPVRSIYLQNASSLLPIEHTILIDNNDRLWVLTDTLHIWDKTKEKALPYPKYFGKEFPAVKGNIISMVKGINNLLYFYTNQQNLYSFETNTFRLEFLGNLKNKVNEFPQKIYGYDSLYNRLLLITYPAGYSTIFDIPSRKIHELNTPALIIKDKLDGGLGCFDTDGYFWIKGPNPVLYKLDKEMKIVDSVTIFQSILPDNYVTIKPVGRDSLMIGDANQCYLFQSKKQTFTLINPDNGVFRQRMAGNYSFINGHIFYLTNLRLQYAPINKFQNIPGKPQIYIAEMKLGKNKIEIPHAVNFHLKNDQNNLSFAMSAVEMNFPERIQYAYRLVNFIDDWTFTDFHNRNIVYTNLPPGKFILQIKARTRGQEWEETKNFSFTIDPPFWQRWWFRIPGAILIMGGIYYFLKLRINHIRKKEQQKAAIEKQMLELEAKALRAQMNPHFIFNSLNSIKSLINKKENEKAASYLTTFSKLIRTLFQNSDKREVSLFEEIETCKLYTQLEQRRFADKVEFIFNVDETIDLKDIKVPALILQPFIENAIWHGLVPKETGGTIIISVKETDSAVVCIIDDDGIGRELSKQYKAQYEATHQSKGIGMTQSRLELDKLLNNREDSVHIIDKTNETGLAIGTKVIITFKEIAN